MTFYKKRGTFKFMMHSAKSLAAPPEKIDGLLAKAHLANTTPPLSEGALEARALIEKAKQLKEKEMQTTLGEQLRAKLDEAAKKESLKSTLNEWDEDEQKQIKGEVMPALPKHLFGISNNASRETFYFIKDNPNLNIAQIKEGMMARGFKENTVSSLAYQMATAGLVAKNNIDHTFVAVAKEFVPFNINKIRREAKLKQQAENKAKVAELNKQGLSKDVVIIKRRTAEQAEAAHNANVAGIGALTVNAEQPTPAPARPRPWRPEDVVDQLTLAQAKEVHAYMQKVFGAL